jgi:oxygen-independent coproporphyrinogen-3 oxidase
VPPALPQGDPAPPTGELPQSARAAVRDVPFGVYVHVPFCQTRCGYCDFNTYTADELGSGVSRGSYADTVLREIHLAAEVLRDTYLPPASTVFFGGGTPTLLPAEHLGLIIREVRDELGLAPAAEITTEANPESVTPGYLAKLREAGFTRISLGMQSAVPRVLEVLDRTHRPGRPEQAVAEARAAGFEHVNLDLIYGSPTETDADWQASLDAAIGAGPDHISAYALIVEEGTALARQVANGTVPAPDDDVMADRYLMADDALARAGFDWYEVSNWSRPGGECRHNVGYWNGGEWWGAGPGAHGYVGATRWWNVKHPNAYAQALTDGLLPVADFEQLDASTRHVEDVMLRLRLRDGLPVAVLGDEERARVETVIADGLVELHADRLVLTDRGRLLADAAVRTLLD